MKLRIATAIAVVVVSVLIPSPASSTGSGYFDDVRSHPRVDHACLYLPYTAHLTLNSDVSDWSLETTVLHPDGTPAHHRIMESSGAGSVTVTDYVELCDPEDPLGEYTLTGVLDTYELDSSHHRHTLDSDAFQVVSVATTTVKLKTSQDTFEPGDRVAFKVIPRAADFFVPKVKIALQRKGPNGSWQWWNWADRALVPLNKVFVIRKTVKQNRDLQVRAKVLGSKWEWPSTSPVVRVFRAQ